MIDNKNIVLAVVLSIIILVGFDMFFATDSPAPPPGDQPGTEKTTPSQAPGLPAPSTPGTAIPSPTGVPSAGISARSGRRPQVGCPRVGREGPAL